MRIIITGHRPNKLPGKPFTSFSHAMIVCVDGTGKHPRGLGDVLHNFKYECQRNGYKRSNRPACKHIFFYVSGGAKQLLYWAIVDFITETSSKRTYFLEAIMKMKKPVPLGAIPPIFNGGALQVPLDVPFKIDNMDKLYDHIV